MLAKTATFISRREIKVIVRNKSQTLMVCIGNNMTKFKILNNTKQNKRRETQSSYAVKLNSNKMVNLRSTSSYCILWKRLSILVRGPSHKPKTEFELSCVAQGEL